jgi:hypothetical protein
MRLSNCCGQSPQPGTSHEPARSARAAPLGQDHAARRSHTDRHRFYGRPAMPYMPSAVTGSVVGAGWLWIRPCTTTGGAIVRAAANAMEDAAHELANAGWSVFPCNPKRWDKEKSPLTEHGHKDATIDDLQIAKWWRKWPKAMIGAAVPDSLLVIDIDPRKGGSLDNLVELVGELPATLTVWSGRNDGGCHLYWRRPAGTFTSTRLKPVGIDLKINGYMIMPPSRHPATGQPYRWEHRAVASLPPKLQALLRPKPQPVQTFGDGAKNGSGLIRAVAEAREGSRHDVLVWASFRALDDGILEEIVDDLIAASVSTGETESKARSTVASVRRAAS